ncbi:MAG: 3-oxoacyl-[acyl-carrier-protein] reductase [candidate division Zixibacteria bacterium]|nr:3-oxoacyl-[acyl-carrier-protein] reductase [candidate division Zixibacteria bacterium]
MTTTGKTVIVTGSTRGIGRAIAEKFVSAGNNVVICGTNQEAADKTASEIGGATLGVGVNVTDAKEIASLMEKTMAKFGRVDIVVNNAGITRDGLMLRMDENDWDAVLDINLKGAFLVTKAAAKVMIKQRYGRIINISSVIGLMGNAGQCNYSASKAGLIGLSKSSARELASRGITVNVVAPGFIETDMTAAMPEAAKEYLMGRVAISRTGTPMEVASAVMFFASDDAGYVTGQVLAVDGGLTM